MVGITGFGAYVPIYRLNRDAIAQAWGRGSLKGERSVANNDEDTATMAVEAVFDCLRGADRESVDALFFASTTSPYREKQTASLLAAVADLKDEVLTADFSNSLRAGTNALRMAHDAVRSGSARNVLVAAADTRLSHPRSDSEQTFGDASAAVVVGDGNPIATFEGNYSIANEMMDVWRNPEDVFVRSGERRWVLGEGYTAITQQAVGGVLRKCGLKASDIQTAVLTAPDQRSQQDLAKKAGFDPKGQLQDPLIATVGDCGAAQPLLMLAAALERAKPGDRILLAAYGDGADAFVLRVTDAIASLPQRRGVQGHVASKMALPSYERYLSYRGILEPVPGEPFRLLPSTTAYWRDRESILRCHGSRCRKCGTLAYPIQRVCYTCRAKDDYEPVRLSDRTGTVFTFSLDNLAGRSDDPVVVQTVLEMDGGARFYCMMTDCVPSEVVVGMRAELTFRRLYEGAGFHNYFWKCRPVRGGGR